MFSHWLFMGEVNEILLAFFWSIIIKGEFYFYGPQKIIAIKPKEIVIADDGASIENSKMHQENRVVLFNLETNSITGVKTSPKEFYFSTSGGDTMNYKPN